MASPSPASGPERPVTVAGVGYLNARPLVAGLEAGLEAPFPYRLITAEPAECAERLRRGEAGAGLVPVASLADGAAAACVPGIGIAAEGEVWSVLLVSRTPRERIRRLAVHAASRSSAALAELLLRMEAGVRPSVRRTGEPLEALGRDADAAVVIGDPALAVRGRTGLEEIDLAAWWREATGLPFVFAVWGLAPGPHREGLADLLERSAAWGLANMDRVLAAAPGDRTLVREYLEGRLRYRLGPPEREGLARFLALAARHGILPETEVVWHERC